MSSTPTPDRALERQLRDMNEALLVSSVRQHELAEQAKRAEAAASESNARFEALFDASPVGMYLVDAQLRIRLVSRTARPVFGDLGGEGGELIGRDFVEVIHILWPPESADEIVARFRHTLETGEPYIAPELSEVRYGGKVREYYDWQIQRITLSDGQYGVVCYFIEISARVLAEQSMRESELRYRRLFQTAKDGILILDAKTGKIIDANAFMSGLVGLESDELLGKELYEIGMFKDVAENKEAFRELQRTGYLRHEHLPVQNQRGESVEVEFIANTYDEDKTLVAQCNVRDISERIAMEKKIKQQAADLAEQSRRKDEFLAMLSHELRNPLAPIRAAVHLLRIHERGSENPIQKEAREVIERQVVNLTKLVSDLLEVSRVISGRIRLNLQTVDLNEVVRHAIETVNPLIQQHRHTLTLEFCSDPVWVSADATRLEEVFINLLNNAAKYTPDGGQIEVHCEHPRGENHALVRVRDNGVGIEAKLLPSIFDLFTQADRSLDRAAGGLGIGLSLAHRLVELHGGMIEAHSPAPGKAGGSEFIVRLPLMPSPTGADDQPPEGAAERGRGQRVLIVDDNADLVTMTAAMLRHRGYSVQTTSNGPDGLKMATTWRPDVVLLDIGLPGLDGYEVARRIRASSDLRERGGKRGPWMIAATGYGRDTDVALAREAGFDAHLVKPFEFDDLEKLIATAKG